MSKSAIEWEWARSQIRVEDGSRSVMIVQMAGRYVADTIGDCSISDFAD